MTYAVIVDDAVQCLFASSQNGAFGEVLIADDDPRVTAFASGATRVQLMAYANEKHSVIMAGGIQVNVGQSGSPQMVEAGTDTASLVLLQGAASVAAVNPSQSFSWVQPSGPVTLTASQIETIFAAVTTFVQSTFTALGLVMTAIGAGSITTHAEIDAYSWPLNS